MLTWLLITIIAASATAGVSIFFILRKLLFSSQPPQVPDSRNPNLERGVSIQSGIAKLHQVDIHHQLDIENGNKQQSYYFLRQNISSQKPLFSWADHPSLVTDAVENGWSRFAFTTPYTSSQSIRPSKTQSLFGSCGGRTEERESAVEITWEVSPGSADFMQKIRINSGCLGKNNPVSVLKTTLPLPGPPISFPQEAYFEITVLGIGSQSEGQLGNLRRMKSESEKSKLIKEDPRVNGGSESIVHVMTTVNANKKKLEGRNGNLVSVGLARTGPGSLTVPGSFPGSVGFDSDGSVYLDGLKLVLESKKQEWAKPDRVIGCGYNLIQKRVFFTIDSQLVHVISCKTEEFGTPLYPTLASNADVTVLVNFGQSAFKYLPANTQRTPNPCFIGPLGHSPTLGYEDSRELFSMGRIDSQWQNRFNARNSANSYAGNNKFGADYDDESEGDLFEIVLEGSNKSPNTVL